MELPSDTSPLCVVFALARDVAACWYSDWVDSIFFSSSLFLRGHICLQLKRLLEEGASWQTGPIISSSFRLQDRKETWAFLHFVIFLNVSLLTSQENDGLWPDRFLPTRHCVQQHLPQHEIRRADQQCTVSSGDAGAAKPVVSGFGPPWQAGASPDRFDLFIFEIYFPNVPNNGVCHFCKVLFIFYEKKKKLGFRKKKVNISVCDVTEGSDNSAWPVTWHPLPG